MNTTAPPLSAGADIPWSQLETIMLDMDGTLLDLHYDSHFWLEHLPHRYARHADLTPDEAQALILERIQREKGTLNWYCIDYWSDTLQMDVAAIKQEVSHKIRFRPLAQAFLRQLQRTHHRVVIVTNAHDAGLSIKRARLGLDSYVDHIYTSHEFGQPKEAQLFWQRLQDAEGFDPGRTLLIDDSQPVLHSAQRYGIAHLLGVLQPDSQEPPRTATELPAIHHFGELLPIHSRPRESV